MKVTRHKKIRKILQFYAITQQLYPPYRVVVDGEFLQACRDGKIMLKEQLPALFHAEATAYVTPCVAAALRQAQAQRHRTGVDVGAALFIAGTLPALKCRHPKGYVSEKDCIRAMITQGNPDRLVVGAQNSSTRQMVRDHPGVPLLFIHGSVPVMEHPSRKDRTANLKTVSTSLHASREEIKLVKKETATPKTDKLKRPKRKLIKGPNPLSCKKSKKEQEAKLKRKTERRAKRKAESSSATASSTDSESITASSESASSASASEPATSSSSANHKRPREENDDTPAPPAPTHSASSISNNTASSSTSSHDREHGEGGAEEPAKRRRVRTRSKKTRTTEDAHEGAAIDSEGAQS